MESPKRFILRKLISTVVATTVLSLLLAFSFVIGGGFESKYNQGNQLMGWFYFYAIYVGAIILFYGNIVSIVMEKVQTKWFPKHHWLYVIILGSFGSAIGLFLSGGYLLLGIPTAILYGVIDKWIFKRIGENKSITLFFLIPAFILLISWGYFQFTSPSQPPFTKEDAVDFATSGKDTVSGRFPENIGEWEDDIEGYKVTRKTSVKETDEEIYNVTFKEHWKKAKEKGYRTLTYEVKRGSLTLKVRKGEVPPYY